MQTPEQIKAGLREGFTAPFFNLLENWGRWSRGKLCQGYHTGQSPQPYTLTDDAGLWIDRAVSLLKKSRPNVWRVFSLHYVNGLDTLDIDTTLRRHRRRLGGVERDEHSYGVNVALLGARSSVAEREIRGFIKLGERIVFDNLLEMEMQRD